MSIQSTTADFAKNLMRASRKVSRQAENLGGQDYRVLDKWSKTLAGKNGIASELRKGSIDLATAKQQVKMASDSFEFKSALQTAKTAKKDPIWMWENTATGRVQVARESFEAARYQSKMADRMLSR